jgi:hypothetical protein
LQHAENKENRAAADQTLPPMEPSFQIWPGIVGFLVLQQRRSTALDVDQEMTKAGAVTGTAPASFG